MQIAHNWNAKDAASGYVTHFRTRSDFLARYPLEMTGACRLPGYWIPTEEKDAFNVGIVEPIEVVAELLGEGA